MTRGPLGGPATPQGTGYPTASDSQRLLLRVEEAAERLGIGRTLMYELVSRGDVESVPVGRLRRIPAECLDEYVTRLRESARANRSVA